MIRVILYLIVIVLLAFGAVWLAERPGEVAITWQGRRLDTSVMVLIAAAVRIAPREPLTLLLSAQSAQLNGDRDTAVATFQELAAREDTRVLGLHGLFVEAQRHHDGAAALAFAEEAARHASVPVWAAQAVLEFRCVAGDWSGALDRLERNMKSGLIDKRTYRRQRAVLFTAQAQSLAGSDRERAIALAR